MRGNHAATEPFYVATEFCPSLEGFLSRQDILCRGRVWPRQKGFVSRQGSLCHDRVCQGKEKFCCDIIV